MGLTLEKIGGFAHSGGASSAEITAFDPLSQRLFVVNGALASVDVLNLRNPASPTLIGSITAASLGAGLANINSVAVSGGVVALAVEATVKTDNGAVVWLRASDLAVLGSDAVGALPDMLTFTPDGTHLLVANEGEPNSYGQPDSVDPVGSVSVIALAGLSPTATPTSLRRTVQHRRLRQLQHQLAALRAPACASSARAPRVAQDLEPEYIAVSADSRTAWVTLQENNALAIVDIASRTVTDIQPLGFKDHSLAGMGMDASDETGQQHQQRHATITIRSVPTLGMYQPDAIASYTVGSQTYLITANEGDAREYTGLLEEQRVRGWCAAPGLDPTLFTDAANLVFDSNLGRLNVTNVPNGDLTGKNGSGQCTALYSFGARSFSIWNSSVTRVFDSGDELERRTQALPDALFNTSNSNNAASTTAATTKAPSPRA